MSVSIVRKSSTSASTTSTRIEDESGLTLDVAQVINPSFDSEVTEYPVESGADHVDHIRPRPVVLQIDGVVSDTPLSNSDSLTAAAAQNGARRSVEALAFLLELRKARELVTVRTPELDYRNMALEQFQVRQDPNTGDALFFTATFKQVLIVTNDRATVRVAVPRAQRKVNLGNKAATPATTPLGWVVDDDSRRQTRIVPYDTQSRRPLWVAPAPQQSLK